MKIFDLTGRVTISVNTRVEAGSLEEAIKIAKEREIESGNWDDDQDLGVWVSSEYDGEVQDIEES
jgi:hypothetical protein